MHSFFTDTFFYVKCRHGCDIIITWSRILVKSREKNFWYREKKFSTFNIPRSNRCGDIAIFVIFNMAAATILNFQKFEILTTCPL